MSDLKVNARTKRLEFKKKHNLLVENVENFGEKIETLEASQDIISKLTPIYNSETDITRFVFPANVLPLRLSSDNFDNLSDNGTIYFDYSTLSVYNNVKQVVGEIVLEEIAGEKHVLIQMFDMEFYSFTPLLTDLSFCYFNNYEEQLNTYYLYHPVTESGTKLYLHSIYTYGPTIKIISATSTRYTTYGQILSDKTVITNINNLNLSFESNTNICMYLSIKQIGPNPSDAEFRSYTIALDGSFSYQTPPQTLNDTVTPL